MQNEYIKMIKLILRVNDLRSVCGCGRALTESEVNVSFAARHHEHMRFLAQLNFRLRLHRHRYEKFDSITMTVERQLSIGHATSRYEIVCGNSCRNGNAVFEIIIFNFIRLGLGVSLTFVILLHSFGEWH